jgi:hypothetical protein
VNDFSFHKFLMLPIVEKISLATTDHEHQPVACYHQPIDLENPPIVDAQPRGWRQHVEPGRHGVVFVGENLPGAVRRI